MTVTRPWSYPGCPLVVDGQGVQVEVETTAPHEVLLTVEYPDHQSFRGGTFDRTIGIAYEDWLEIVAHVERERERVQPVTQTNDDKETE